MSEMEPLRIDVLQDFACPWCRIGKRQLDRATNDMSLEDVAVRFHPYMLRPDLPMEGVDFRTMLTEKFGGEDTLKQMFDRVTKAGKAAGIEFDFDKIEKSPNTITAHRMMAMTAPSDQSALADRIYDAYFRDGRDIGDIDTLVAIANEAGLDGESYRARLKSPEMLRETAEAAMGAARAGIGGVPFFVFADQVPLSGAQPVEVFTAAIEKAMKPEPTNIS